MNAPKESPALDSLTIGLERSSRLGLCQVVTPLLVCGTLYQLELSLSLVVLFPEPMPTGRQILGPVSDTLIRGKEVTTLVVLEHSGMDPSVFQPVAVRLLDHFLD